MPDIEALMQIWPAQVEELLETAKLPGADLQVCLHAPMHSCAFAPLRPGTLCTRSAPALHPLCTALHALCTRYAPPLHPLCTPSATPLQAELPELVRIVCALLDIPVYSSLTESLHVLFSLYSDFKARNRSLTAPPPRLFHGPSTPLSRPLHASSAPLTPPPSTTLYTHRPPSTPLPPPAPSAEGLAPLCPLCALSANPAPALHLLHTFCTLYRPACASSSR